jgi:hypothetical protein
MWPPQNASARPSHFIRAGPRNAWLGRVAHFCAFRKSGAFSERGCHAQIVPHGHRQRISFWHWRRAGAVGAAPFAYKGWVAQRLAWQGPGCGLYLEPAQYLVIPWPTGILAAANPCSVSRVTVTFSGSAMPPAIAHSHNFGTTRQPSHFERPPAVRMYINE